MLVLPVFLLGFWAYHHHRATSSTPNLRAMLIGWILMSFAVLGLLFFVGGSLLPYIALRVRMARSSYEVLEGAITDFRTGHGGTRLETWTLQTHNGARSYAYSAHVLGGGYDGTGKAGSRLRNGLHARLYDVGGRIARLEVAC
jgi:hypothetical protein